MPEKSEKYLVFDCSTVGKPKRWNAMPTDTFNWPRILHLAYRLYDADYNLLEKNDYIIHPDGTEIPEETARLHHIDQAMAEKEGRPIAEVLSEFQKVIDISSYAFAFNMQLNYNTLAAAFHRAGIEQRLDQTERYCIMEESTFFCKLPGRDGRYKWPTLQELYQRVYGKKYEGAYRADKNVEASANCLFALIKADQIDIFF